MSDITVQPTAELIAQRTDASAAYYGGNTGAGETLMTDDAFDALTAELVRRGVKEQVGHGAAGGKVAHVRPMLSLKKVHDVADLEALVSSHPTTSFTIEPKFDGLSASVRYRDDGQIEVALTRGDGERGEDITPAVRAMLTRQQLPLELPGKAEVRGEIVMLRSAFSALNESLKESGADEFANPRNAAAGMIARVARNLDALRHELHGTDSYDRRVLALETAVTDAGRWLTFLPFHAEGTAALTPLSAEFLFPNARGLSGRTIGGATPGKLAPFPHYVLPTAPFRAISEEINHPVAWLGEHLDAIDVDTDGVVLKLDDQDVRAQLGESSTAPRWAIAYKFPNRPKQTVLRAVEWSETRTGRVVPTAVFDPVELSGAMVSRATLNNFSFLEELDIWIGDTVEVTRANEVIPNVVGRVGAHAKGATPVPGPDGWPVGAGTLKSMSLTNQRRVAAVCDPSPKSLHDIKLVTIFDGNPERRNEVTAEEYYDHEAHIFNPEGEEDVCVSVHAVFDHEEVAAAVMEWMRHRLMKAQVDLQYHREGRDLVHDGGRDLVQDISFAAGALDILGLGEDVVRRLLAGNDEIFHFADLISICWDGKLQPFERGTQKLVDKLTDEVLSKISGPQDPAKWIKAAGITGIGYRAGKKLCAGMVRSPAWGDSPSPFDVLKCQTASDILAIDGFGPSAAQAITQACLSDWISIEDIDWDWSKYEPAADGIAAATAPLDSAEADPGSSFPPAPTAKYPLSGMRVLVTGTFPSLSRKQAEQRIEDLGGDVASSVSKNLDLLVAGEKAGSKLTKAESLGIPVMGAVEFEGLGKN